MFQLYKSRDFSLFFKDTFAFIKMHGKHFFKNYLIVNGLFLAILIAMNYIAFSSIAEMDAQGLLDEANQRALLEYIKRNSDAFITYGILYLIVSIIFGVLAFAYVPFYFKLYEKHKGPNFSSKEVVKELMDNIGKLFKFILVTILISIPLLIAFSIVVFIMAITIIGFPFIIFIIALLSLFFHSSLMEYLKTEDKGVFDCYGYSIQLCFDRFFHSIGAVGIFMLIIIIFQYVISFIQGTILYFLGVSVLDSPTYLSDLNKTSIIFIVAFLLQIIVSLINYLNSAILQIHEAIVYYGLKEDRENIHTQDTIDTIGRN
ncbi:hypothetical protein KORDIASMS9_02723 [Kordia sp. SMS9]|uniref:hypothetical protein n=1 Tax=Kordia sp. SMS9 TaxID=2282170 RepID=UPI000E0CE3CD|nr:hypothetical protein [Kordia sp. SMS9]AXG70483.1 hypothetical protein KORDIASMS9_02723 [Kordia sp. SMS9]